LCFFKNSFLITSIILSCLKVKSLLMGLINSSSFSVSFKLDKSVPMYFLIFFHLFFETRMFFETIESKTKRRPYVRSAYFEKRKVFFDLFWKHLYQKSFKERSKRLKFIRCAVELVEKSRNDPDSIEEKRGEIWHRFGGLTKSGELFYVQVKEDKKTRRLDFMSVFPG